MKAVAETKKTAAKTQEVSSVASISEGSDLGLVKIHENVIASLVRRATLETEGVSRLSGSSIVDNIAEIVGSRRMQARAISIDLSEENRVRIEVKLNIKFGYKVPELAEKVQKAVISLVESTTGMTVTSVNVLIQDIEEEEPVVDEEAEADSVPAAALPPQ